MIEIKTIDENKKGHIELLLLADPYEVMIDKYLDKGIMYALYDNDELTCIAVVIEISKETCELKNIATYEHFQNRGYASKMINHILDVYSEQYSSMVVGTAESGIPFYEKFGFVYSHKIKNFFIDNYPEPIFEGESQCVDMLYLEYKF
ncbi:GNAT family N-acetyltransferase [Clostridioides sp. ES-S-0005-03]|uniref:GNAT family N-acetyltransferase n=1 Tax=Clostridioides sp. ES-S-0005-03 TaxID=2770774 RepID=UPI001D126CC1|nr:GNAT family N-acetyltransferase [Clostridioides sp. ES-S-0005-03]UDN48146.1 GNAT family N-acetyltransferase [Clostridioides sp. ES-S-0173-01]